MIRGSYFRNPPWPHPGSGRVNMGVAPEGRSKLVRLFQAIKVLRSEAGGAYA
jgi:hypothetical protein